MRTQAAETRPSRPSRERLVCVSVLSSRLPAPRAGRRGGNERRRRAARSRGRPRRVRPQRRGRGGARTRGVEGRAVERKPIDAVAQPLDQPAPEAQELAVGHAPRRGGALALPLLVRAHARAEEVLHALERDAVRARVVRVGQVLVRRAERLVQHAHPLLRSGPRHHGRSPACVVRALSFFQNLGEVPDLDPGHVKAPAPSIFFLP